MVTSSSSVNTHMTHAHAGRRQRWARNDSSLRVRLDFCIGKLRRERLPSGVQLDEQSGGFAGNDAARGLERQGRPHLVEAESEAAGLVVAPTLPEQC